MLHIQKDMLNIWWMILFSKKATSNNLLAFLNLLNGLGFFSKKKDVKISFGFCKARFSKEPGSLWKLEMMFDATLHSFYMENTSTRQLEHVCVSSGWILWQVG